jgi:prepilin-type processing-associated H-X9-DG protein
MSRAPARCCRSSRATGGRFSTPASPLDYVGLLRHLGGANDVFADGHAKWFKPEATLRARQSTKPTGNLWTWDKDTFPEFQ